MPCFQLYPRPSRSRDARCSGGKMTCCTRESEISSQLYLIHRWNISLQTTRLIADKLFVEVSAQVSQQPSAYLDRNANLNQKKRVKYGDFPDKNQSFRFFVRSSHCCKLHEAPKQPTSSMNRSCRVLSREPLYE